jgi:hypothetical protein
MTAHVLTDASTTTVSHDLEAVLRLRAWARATLWQAGALELSEAVDVLQADAERDGLVELLGQDRVQDIIAAAFAEVRDDVEPNPEREPEAELTVPCSWDGLCDVCGYAPCVTPAFCTASRHADADLQVVAESKRSSARLPADWDRMDFGALHCALNTPARQEGRAAASTYRAALHALRPPHGNKATLARQAERLRQFSDRQIENLICQLKKAGADAQVIHALVELLP